MFVCPLSYLNRVQVYNCVYRVQFECVALRLNVYECVIVIRDSILCHTTTLIGEYLITFNAFLVLFMQISNPRMLSSVKIRLFIDKTIDYIYK